MPIYTSHVSASTAVTSSQYKVDTSLLPDGNDGATIGAAGNAFSDVFLAEGGVINWDSGDATLTQAGNVVTLAGATFAGTLSTAAQPNITSVGTLTDLTVTSVNNTVSITDTNNNGTLDGVVIGGTSAVGATFTTLSSTGNTVLGSDSNDTITLNGIDTGTDNTVLVVNGSGTVLTDEIDSRVWGATLVDASGTPANNQVAIWTDANTVEGDSKVTWDGATFAVDGDLRAINYIVSSSVTYMTQSFSSGSTIFGDTMDDRHEFTGSLYVTGSATFSEALSGLTLVTPALGTPASATLTNATGLPVNTGISGMASGISGFLATPSSANLRSAVTDETGTGALVFATSPTFVTPALGTPASATLTNATGLPVAGVTGMAEGMSTFLGTPSSANLRSVVTDETGTGALVFATSPTLVTPALGTPASGVATNLTGTAAGLTAGAVSTIAGLAPNTATTQATQPNITSLGTLTGLTVHGNATIGNSGDPGVHTINGQLKNFSKASGSIASTGSFGHVVATTLKGDGSQITGLTSAAIDTTAGMTNNYVLTATGASAVTGESALTFDGATGVLTVTGTIAGTAVKDEDNMASDSATHLASQQSIKAYVDSSVTAQDLDATTDSGTIDIDLDSEALTVAGGAGISTSATGTTITIAADSAALTAAGIVELATSAETITGTDAGRAVTPDGLNARIAEGAAGNISGSSTSTGSFGYLYTAGGGITAGTILPSTDNAYDLGSASYRFANLYVGDLMMSNKSRGGNEVDGTYGDYTIQEGEEDLYLLNHRNGKTYRFKLEEVDSRPWYKKIFS